MIFKSLVSLFFISYNSLGVAQGYLPPVIEVKYPSEFQNGDLIYRDEKALPLDPKDKYQGQIGKIIDQDAAGIYMISFWDGKAWSEPTSLSKWKKEIELLYRHASEEEKRKDSLI